GPAPSDSADSEPGSDSASGAQEDADPALAASQLPAAEEPDFAERGGVGLKTGIGIGLVKGLVGRELHGSFAMRPTPQGGTTATVRIPVMGDGQDRQDGNDVEPVST